MRNTYLHYITVYPTVVPTLNPFKCITKIQLISPPLPLIKVDFKLEKEEISFSEEEGNRIYSHKWKEHSAPLKNQILEIAPSLQLCIPLLSSLRFISTCHFYSNVNSLLSFVPIDWSSSPLLLLHLCNLSSLTNFKIPFIYFHLSLPLTLSSRVSPFWKV